MKKNILLTVLFAFASLMANAQLLYKISGKGLANSSYIVGTYHLAPASFADSIPGIRQAMADCQQTYGELVMNQMMSADSVALLQQAMMPNAMLNQQMGKMSPSGLSTTLSMLSFMKKEGNVDVTNLIDDYFQKETLAQGKGIGGLETVGFQIKVLFKGQTMERQKQLLMCLVDNAKVMDEMTDKVRKAYYSQDIDAVKEALDAKLYNSCDQTPEEEDALINNRNADWLTKMPALMSQKPTLFAVGAGHLPGPKGVLNLLREAGYRVEPMK